MSEQERKLRLGVEQLERTRLSAEFWANAAKGEADPGKCSMYWANARNHWMNAAYAKSEECEQLRAEVERLRGCKFSDRDYHALKSRAEQAEQRIAESRRQKPAAWMAHIPQVGGTYSVHLQEEKHHPLGVAWEEPLYAAPIVPPTVEEAVKELADWIATQRNDVPATGEEFAAAIRARSGSGTGA